MTFELRPYQIETLNIIDRDLKVMPEVLIQGVTGCGKTTIFSRLINKYYHETDKIFLVLVHKQEVVQQIYDTLRNRTDILFQDLGICCASLNQKTIDRRVIVASIQTFVNLKEQYGYADLIIIDEVHKVDVSSDSQYKSTLDYLRLQKPNCRILGFTSTPARLDHGYIYGGKCKKGSTNLFPKLNHTITYEELRKTGYLVPLKGVVANHESLEKDLAGVSINGDYSLNEIGEIFTQERHLGTAVEAIEKYCGDYKKICVFCCTIDHCEQLSNLLGDESTTVHSQLNSLDRQSNMNDWKSGKKRIITSCMMLTEGVDIPELECLVFARPTLSSTLWLQAVGRVLRIHPGKDHGFLVDLTCNTSRFGVDLDNVKITVPKSVEKVEEKERSLIKVCPNCEMEVHVATRICDCGFEWPPPEILEAEMPEMKNVVFVKSPPKQYEIIDWAIEEHESKSSGKTLGKLTFIYQSSPYKESRVYMWLCFQDQYQGFAVQKSMEKWAQISDAQFPKSVEEFMESHFKEPKNITVDINGKYPELISVDCPVVEYEDDLPF